MGVDTFFHSAVMTLIVGGIAPGFAEGAGIIDTGWLDEEQKPTKEKAKGSGTIAPPDAPPTALIAYTPAGGFAPLTVEFDGSASTPQGAIFIQQYSWDFGDGVSASGDVVEHTFEEPGTYNVSLTVLDNLGRTDSDSVEIEVMELLCRGKRATIVGSAGPDRIAGSQARDVIATLGGKDRVSAGAGNDLVCAGSGKDMIKGGKGNDTLFGKAGKDRLVGGGSKRDRCVGGPGHDRGASCEKGKM